MANNIAAILAICVFAFYVLLAAAICAYWLWSKRQRRRQLAEMEEQAIQYIKDRGIVLDRNLNGKHPYSRTASMFSDGRSVRSMFYEGPPSRKPSSESTTSSTRSTRSRHSNASSATLSTLRSSERRYSSPQSNLIPLRQVSSDEGLSRLPRRANGAVSVYSDRSRASSVSTLRYYAEAMAEEHVPPLPTALLVDGREHKPIQADL